MGQALNIAGICLGVVLFYRGLRSLQLFYKLRQTGIKGEGTVVERIRLGSAPATVPVISFYDNLGNEIKNVPKNAIRSRGFGSHEVGDKVMVYFDKDNPSLFVADASLFKSVSFITFGLGCLSLLINGQSLFF